MRYKDRLDSKASCRLDNFLAIIFKIFVASCGVLEREVSMEDPVYNHVTHWGANIT